MSSEEYVYVVEERRRWGLALASLALGGLGVAALFNTEPEIGSRIFIIFFGLVILFCVGYAGYLSNFWAHVETLPTGQRIFVKGVAYAGIAMFVLAWLLWVFARTYLIPRF